MLEFDAALSTAVDVKGNPARANDSAAGVKVAGSLSAELLDKMNRYWCAANYLVVGQIYLLDNRAVARAADESAHQAAFAGALGNIGGAKFYLRPSEPADSGDARKYYLYFRSRSWRADAECLRVSRRNLHRSASRDYAGCRGMRLLFRSFSTPGGIPSHCGPHTPNSMHEGGELGYSLVHAFGAAFDNPDLIVACVVGDGEAETCPLEGSWKGVKFLNPARDGAVLPILHLNGYKISGPTVTGAHER